ncbi:MAG TPA: VOC family protein [Steroidobacteraceae bacterium]|nr:VOC family protein [Steroidobacteraceae bacterium]
MTTTKQTQGIGIRRLQHLVLYVSDLERSRRFYEDVLGFETAHLMGSSAAFLRIPGAGNDHDLGLFAQPGIRPPDPRVARMYHSAWQVDDLADLARAQMRLTEAGALVGASNHGASLSLYAQDPDGLEFEIFWAVPEGTGELATRALDLEAELRRRGIPWPAQD